MAATTVASFPLSSLKMSDYTLIMFSLLFVSPSCLAKLLIFVFYSCEYSVSAPPTRLITISYKNVFSLQ